MSQNMDFRINSKLVHSKDVPVFMILELGVFTIFAFQKKF